MNDDTAPYRLPDNDSHPAVIAERVMRMPEHLHLVDNEIEIDWLMRTHEKIKGGRMILGSVHEPTCQGEFKILFQWMLENLLGRLPRFLIILDEAYWKQASAHDREILVFHELSHVKHMLDRYGSPRFDKDGMPVYGLKNHDVEEFSATVARYGAYSEELRNFMDACNQNG